MAVIRLTRRASTNLTLLFALAALGGCLSDDSAKDWSGSEQPVTLSGSVGDGPVVGASMVAVTNSGEEIMAFESDANASYNVTVDAATEQYPLTVIATGGTDLVTNDAPDFEMRGAVAGGGDQSVANVNPHTTIATLLATRLPGGLSGATLADAEATVAQQLNCGLDSLALSSVMSTHIDETNIAEIVRASETLAEAVRRTRDLLITAGFASSGDAVVDAIASDLTDGVVNGAGAASADARTAAITTIVFAQVLMESMANELHVNGIDATTSMATAIEQVSVRPPSETLADLLVTDAMIRKARIGIAAATAIDSDPRLADLHTTVSGLQRGMGPMLVRSLLPQDYRSILQNALAVIAGADDATISTINDIAVGDGELAPGNRAPTISGTPATFVEAEQTYMFTPTANDPDGDPVTFSIANPPAWVSFDSATGALAGTPAMGDIGVYNGIVISVSDGEFSDSLAAFSIEVFSGNVAPTISGTPATRVIAGQSYVFAPTASDPNGDALTFTIANQPAWSTFNSSTGRLSGAPFESDVGTYADIVISVSDGQLSQSLPAFTIAVDSGLPPPNNPPVISGTPPVSAVVGAQYSFLPTASDPDGNALTFTITNRPSWATFNTSTGQLQGTPAAADVGTNADIVISVSDGMASASLNAFTITVEAAPSNTPPTISGDPPTQVNADTAYSFTPTASDADGDTLTFSIANQPSWASFDAATGQISGTPSSADVGTYPDIRITVSDGAATASIEFTITVNAISLGSVTLNWTAPTLNEDGTQLTDLAGYRIYWGTNPGSYPNSVTIDNESVTTYVVENLAPGTYEFVATAFNTSGVESTLSNSATATVP